MSKLNRIREMLQKVLTEFEKISTDKALLVFDGDVLEIGMMVRGLDEDGNEFDLEDGEYRADDNTVYVIKDGRVEDIVMPDSIDEEPAVEDKPIEEPMSEEEPMAEEEPAAEPEPEEDPRDRRIADLEAEVARLEEENGELRERIKELEDKPMADPVEEDFEKVSKVESTGNSKLDKALRILNA